MKVNETSIPGVLTIEPDVFGDARGYFFESYNREKYFAAGIEYEFVQDNESFSTKGVLRGLHYQAAPYTQAKLIRVIEGHVMDVVVDIRKNSPTYGKHLIFDLTGENKLQVMIPRGMAHGFIVLSETARFAYKCDNKYAPPSERCIRFDDPDIHVDWRLPKECFNLSPKDLKGVPFASVEPLTDGGF